MKLRNNQGFTLVELMIVIVIVGILAAVAIPKFTSAADKAKASEFGTVLTSVYTSQEAQRAETGSYTTDWSLLTVSTDPSGNSKWFNYTLATANSAQEFTGTATVKVPFGGATTTDNATINHLGARTVTNGLGKYNPNWKTGT